MRIDKEQKTKIEAQKQLLKDLQSGMDKLMANQSCMTPAEFSQEFRRLSREIQDLQFIVSEKQKALLNDIRAKPGRKPVSALMRKKPLTIYVAPIIIHRLEEKFGKKICNHIAAHAIEEAFMANLSDEQIKKVLSSRGTSTAMLNRLEHILTKGGTIISDLMGDGSMAKEVLDNLNVTDDDDMQ